MKYFHSGAGTMISAFGNAGLSSGVSSPLMWSPWKWEMIDDVDLVAVDAGGLQVGVELPGGALAVLEVRLAGAGVDHDQLRAGVHGARAVRDRDHVRVQLQIGGSPAPH